MIKHVLYLNVYEVNQEYGGPEEGGWWYNSGTPLASVPIPAIRRNGHDDTCFNCKTIRSGWSDGELCRQDPMDDYGEPMKVDDPNYQEEYLQQPFVTHLVPKMSDEELHAKQEELQNMFFDSDNPRHRRGKSSCAGGEDITVCLEDHFAEPYPNQRPRYE